MGKSTQKLKYENTKSALFLVITHRVVVISYLQIVPKRRSEITTTCCVITPKRAFLIYLVAEAWNTRIQNTKSSTSISLLRIDYSLLHIVGRVAQSI
jgi:hypothetical protein